MFDIISEARFERDAARKNVEDHLKSIDKDIAHGLEWSENMFKDGASAAVMDELIDSIEHQTKPGETQQVVALRVLKGFQDEVERRIRYHPSSTSTASNLFQTYKAEAYMKAVDLLRRACK